MVKKKNDIFDIGNVGFSFLQFFYAIIVCFNILGVRNLFNSSLALKTSRYVDIS